MKQALHIQPGDWVNWESKGTYYLVENAWLHESGWMFVQMKGHPTKTCTIWPTVEMPCYHR
jgi:hypothetical protein